VVQTLGGVYPRTPLSSFFYLSYRYISFTAASLLHFSFHFTITAALGTWTGTMILVSHDEEFVKQLEPTNALIMPEGDFQPWSEDLLEIVSLA